MSADTKLLRSLRDIQGNEVFEPLEREVKEGRARYLLLAGPPGQGKTTVAAAVAEHFRGQNIPVTVTRVDDRIKQKFPGIKVFPDHMEECWTTVSREVAEEVKREVHSPEFRSSNVFRVLEAPLVHFDLYDRTNGKTKRFGIGVEPARVLAPLPEARAWRLIAGPEVAAIAQHQIRECGAPPITAAAINVGVSKDEVKWFVHGNPKLRKEKIAAVRRVKLPSEIEEDVMKERISPSQATKIRLDAYHGQRDLRRLGFPTGISVFNPGLRRS